MMVCRFRHSRTDPSAKLLFEPFRECRPDLPCLKAGAACVTGTRDPIITNVRCAAHHAFFFLSSGSLSARVRLRSFQGARLGRNRSRDGAYPVTTLTTAKPVPDQLRY
jgi:hypothetical protein